MPPIGSAAAQLHDVSGATMVSRGGRRCSPHGVRRRVSCQLHSGMTPEHGEGRVALPRSRSYPLGCRRWESGFPRGIHHAGDV
jgi:hypothetical protein